MSSVDELLADLETGIEQESGGPSLQASQALRERAGELLDGVRLEPEDPVLAKRRRLHHRLEVLEAKVQAGRFGDAEEDREAVEEIARDLVEAVEAREPAEAGPPAWGRFRRIRAIAAREVGKLWSLAAIVAGLAVLVLGLDVSSPGPSLGASEAGAATLAPAVTLAALGGAGLAAGRLADDRERDRLALLVGHGLSRAGVLAAKGLGVGLSILVALAGPGLLAGLTDAVVGDGLAVGRSVTALAGLVLVAASFAALVLAVEARGTSAEASFTAGVLGYVVLGPLWRQAFLAGAADGEGATALGAELVHLASPVAAARHAWTTGSGLGLAVLLVWGLVGLGLATWWALRDGFPRAT